MVQEYIEKNHPLELENLKLRLRRFNDLKNRRKVDDFWPLMQLDVLDDNFVWRVARVVTVEYSYETNEAKSLKIKYTSPRSEGLYTINVPSSRLASKGFYTSRKEIPHYSRKKVVFEDQARGRVMHLSEWNKAE